PQLGFERKSVRNARGRNAGAEATQSAIVDSTTAQMAIDNLESPFIAALRRIQEPTKLRIANVKTICCQSYKCTNTPNAIFFRKSRWRVFMMEYGRTRHRMSVDISSAAVTFR